MDARAEEKKWWFKWGKTARNGAWVRQQVKLLSNSARRSPGRLHQKSLCSFRYLLSSIPSWNTDQGVHRSWECCSVETSNTKWKWNEREGGNKRPPASLAGLDFFDNSEQN